jgi:hypothetical protein
MHKTSFTSGRSSSPVFLYLLFDDGFTIPRLSRMIRTAFMLLPIFSATYASAAFRATPAASLPSVDHDGREAA